MRIWKILILPVILILNFGNIFCQNKRIYIAPDDHSDIWWRADLETYNQAFLEMLDYYIDLADQTKNESPDFQSRWNCDGSYWMWIYEKNRSATQFQKLISYMKSGHISVPLNPVVEVWGATPAEAVIRSMYYAGRIERQNGLEMPLVYSMENQTLPLGLATLWKESGAKYSWKGICQCATNVDGMDRDHEIYWMQGLDDSKILMKWYSLSENGAIPGLSNPNMGPGGYAEVRIPQASIDYVLNNQNFVSKYPYDIIGLFGKGWDDLETLTNEFPSIAKNNTNTSQTVRVSNEIDFFEDFEAKYGSIIPGQCLSYGNDWDLGSAAIQEISSRLKRATEKLRNAESMSVLASLADPSFLNGRSNARELAWINMGLFFDHNLAFPGPYVSDADAKRTAWQRQLVTDIESYINKLHDDAIVAISNGIIRNSSNPRFFVYNSLNWNRTDVTDLDFNQPGPVKVIDLTNGREAPSQVVVVNNKTYLRILASDVPPAGYKVYEIVNGSGEIFSNAANVTGNIMENSYYKVTVTQKGSISSILSKKHDNKELIQTIDSKSANDLGGSVTGSMIIENSGPVSVTYLVNSSSELNHTTRVTLFRDIDRINIDNTINQNFNSTETWAYCFNIQGHTIHHEEVGAILTAKTASNGGHYANKNANYDWLTINHFADVSNENLGVTLSNADCFFMKTGNSSVTSLDQSLPEISVLAGGRIYNNGLSNQGGDNSFTQRFALTVHNAYSPAAAMRFALEHQNPLVSGKVNGGTTFPEKSMSLITIDNPDVILWSLKPSEEGIGSGVIARMWNINENSANYSFGSAYQITGAKNVTLIETPISTAGIINNKVAGQINSFGFKTLNLSLNFESAQSLEVSPVSLNIGSSSGSTAINVSSNLTWSVSDDASWLTATKTTDTTITVIAEKNNSQESRTAFITVTATGGLTKIVSVTQAPANANLTVTPDSIKVGASSGYATFMVTSNVDWTVSENEIWLNAVRNDTSTIGVAYDKNSIKSSRTGDIVVSGPGIVNRTVKLIQEGDTLADTSVEIKDLGLSVYPNPVRDYMIVKFGNAVVGEVFFSLTDALGRVLYLNKLRGSNLNEELDIDFSSRAKGIYFFSVKAGRSSKVFKIIKI